MDYLDIVLQGCFNKNNREHLEKYFHREFQKAKKEFYEVDEFFNGCLSVIENWELSSKNRMYERKKELYWMKHDAKNKSEDLACYEEELISISYRDFPIHLHSLTKGRIAYNMPYSELEIIKSKLIESYLISGKADEELKEAVIKGFDFFKSKNVEVGLDEIKELFRFLPILLNNISIQKDRNEKCFEVGELETLKKSLLDYFMINEDLLLEYNSETYNLDKRELKDFIEYYYTSGFHQKWVKRINELTSSDSVGKPFLTEQMEEPFRFNNSFDTVSTEKVYAHFKKGLVESKMLNTEELETYLKAAFDVKQIPKELFSIKNAQSKDKVMKVFYEYYKNIAGKPHGKQSGYAELLGEYFQGYKTSTIKSNFSKSVY